MTISSSRAPTDSNLHILTPPYIYDELAFTTANTIYKLEMALEKSEKFSC